MFGKRFSRALAVVTVASLVMATAAFADNTVADGDGLAAVANNDMAFGSVACNVASSKTALIAISRNGSATGTNTFANGAEVTVSVLSVSGAGLSATIAEDANTISLPSNWTGLPNNTLSSGTVTANVGLTSSASGTGTVNFRATGLNTDGDTITRDDAMTVTWTTGSCAPPNTAPTTPGTPSGSPNPNNTGNFTVSWAPSTDAQSNPITYALERKDANDAAFASVASGIGTNSYGETGVPEGTWTYRVKASDGSLSSAYSSVSAGVVVDQSAPAAPTASADRAPDYAGGGGWYLNTVTVSFADDGDPNLGDGSAGSGVDAATLPSAQTKTSSGIHVVSGTVKDLATNESNLSSLTVQVDATQPNISYSSCPTSVTLDSIASAAWTASDDHSGLATTSSGTETLDTSSIGTKSNSVTAADNVGLMRTATCTYSVIYDFAGFFRPVDNLPSLNVSKAGSAIPIKFSLGGNQGLNVMAAGFPTSKVSSCDAAGDPDVIEETVTAGQSSLSYDSTSDQYVYVWKTDKGWAGTCRTLSVKLADGTVHQALFKLTK